METLVLHTKDKKESKLLMAILNKMNISVTKLSNADQEDIVFGNLIKSAVKQGKAKAESIEQIIGKWK